MTNTVSAATTTTPSRSLVVVPEQDYYLFRQVGIVPPEEEGKKFDLRELDKQLAPLDTNTSMKVKAALVRCKLLDRGPSDIQRCVALTEQPRRPKSVTTYRQPSGRHVLSSETNALGSVVKQTMKIWHGPADKTHTPHVGGGTTQGAKIPPTGNAGKQPMPAAPDPVNHGVDD